LNTQASAGHQATGGEFEHAAQLLRRTEVGHHLGDHDQPIVPAQVVHGREDVALNNTDIQRLPLGLRVKDVGEFRGHLDRVYRMAASRQGEGVTPVPAPMSSTQWLLGSAVSPASAHTRASGSVPNSGGSRVATQLS
jgi:hypothetical protein